LEELTNKQYIKHENSKWLHTNKGQLVSTTLVTREEFTKIIFTDNFHSDQKNFKLDLEKEVPLFARSMPEVFDEIINPNIIFLLRDITSEQIKMGVDIDNMSNDNFKNMIITMAAMHVSNRKVMKNISLQKNISQNAPKQNRKTLRQINKLKK
jgi:hypothetical protein